MSNRNGEEMTAKTDDVPKGLKYSVLEDEHKRQILRDRLEQIEAEHYRQSVSVQLNEEHLGTELEANAKAGINGAHHQMLLLEQAHATVSAELIKLGS